MSEEQSDIKYDGWAPCIHSEEEIVKAKSFIKDVLGGEAEGLLPYDPSRDRDTDGGKLEHLLWELTISFNATPSFYADQWVAVATEGKIGDKTIHTWIQADTFLLGLAETVRWWREKKKELKSVRESA